MNKDLSEKIKLDLNAETKVSLENFGLGRRTLTCLNSAGIDNLAALIFICDKYNPKSLKMIRNFGDACVHDVNSLLTKVGVHGISQEHAMKFVKVGAFYLTADAVKILNYGGIETVQDLIGAVRVGGVKATVKKLFANYPIQKFIKEEVLVGRLAYILKEFGRDDFGRPNSVAVFQQSYNLKGNFYADNNDSLQELQARYNSLQQESNQIGRDIARLTTAKQEIDEWAVNIKNAIDEKQRGTN